MSRRTKKVGVAGRLGPRYGLSVRKQIRNIETEQRKRHECPRCRHASVRRESTGIWNCRHCSLRFAGGAYAPTTAAGRARTASGKGGQDKAAVSGKPGPATDAGDGEADVNPVSEG